jgi:hypothetical protein
MTNNNNSNNSNNNSNNNVGFGTFAFGMLTVGTFT